MIEKEFAERFAAEWIAAWNSHDLDRVLSQYSDDFTMSSPLIAKIAEEPTGTLKGKEKVRAYWSKALKMIPDLHFDLVSFLVGVDSITLCYKGHRGLAAEVLHFDRNGKVIEGYAHYQ